MSSHARTPTLTVASLNVNGLNNAGKRHAMFKALQDHIDGADVLCLQETHCPSLQAAQQWTVEGAGPGLPFRGPAAWALGSSASRGVAILIRPEVRVDGFECIHQCLEGRIVGAHFSIAGSSYLLFSVYAPAEGHQRVPFFTGPLRAALREAVQRHPGAKLLVAGDFNCIECVSLDQVGGTASTGRVEGFSPGLQPLQLEFGLADSFRALHPTTRAFTHRATSGTSAARLDRILVSDTLVPHLLAAGMQDGWEGDHRLVFAALTPPQCTP